MPMALTKEQALAAIKAYNKGLDRKRRRNIDVDSEARRTFGSGLGTSLLEIETQVRFIGDDYGGVAGIRKALELSGRIAQAIFSNREKFLAAAQNNTPLKDKIPNRNSFEILFAPFQQELKLKDRLYKNWLVWATKFGHFLNANTFPIMDRFVADFTGLRSQANSVEKYMELMRRLQVYIVARDSWLPAMRIADNGYAWSDLKLWDKVIYQIGYEKRGNCK
jgi:hypothetical protein